MSSTGPGASTGHRRRAVGNGAKIERTEIGLPSPRIADAEREAIVGPHRDREPRAPLADFPVQRAAVPLETRGRLRDRPVERDLEDRAGAPRRREIPRDPLARLGLQSGVGGILIEDPVAGRAGKIANV